VDERRSEIFVAPPDGWGFSVMSLLAGCLDSIRLDAH